MEKEFLNKIRRLNWVLSQSTAGSLSYDELSKLLSEVINTNFYIIDRKGFVLAGAYTDAADKTTFHDELGFEKIPESDNYNILQIEKTEANLIGEELSAYFGESYALKDKYHTLVPAVCGGERFGTILLAKHQTPCTEEEIVLAEYGAALVGLELQRNEQRALEIEKGRHMAVEIGMFTLSNSEKDAIEKILDEMKDEEEGTIVASKLAREYGLTNSVIVSALKKLESAGILEAKSLGMKGTHIKILNPYIKEKTRKW